MCNAKRHPAGCECGFGPPYPGFIAFDPPVKWEEAVLDEPQIIRESLAQMDWDSDSIEEFIERYNEIIASALPRDGMISKIKKLLGMRRVEVEEVKRDVLNVPLFRFGAPRTKGSKITYQEVNTSERDATWRVKVFGIGTGDTRSMSVKNARTFVANYGECKVVYAPIPMKVERVSVYDGDRLVGSGYRAEVVPPKKSESSPFTRRGCKSLSTVECEAAPAGDHRDEIRLDLEGDRSKSIHEHLSSWKSSLAEDLSVSLSDMANLSTTVKVKNIREISIKSQLPSGSNYLGRIYPTRLWWKR